MTNDISDGTVALSGEITDLIGFLKADEEGQSMKWSGGGGISEDQS